MKTQLNDIINFFRFRRDIKKLKKNDIKFNELKLNHNWLCNIVYTQINCTDEEIIQYNYSPIDAVMNKIKPHIDYLTDIGYGDYLIPEITNFVDDDGNNTLSYLILFVYTPVKFSLVKFIYQLFGLIFLCISGYLIYQNYFI